MQRTISSVFVILVIANSIACTREKPYSPSPFDSQPQESASTPLSNVLSNTPMVSLRLSLPVSSTPIVTTKGSPLAIQPSTDAISSTPTLSPSTSVDLNLNPSSRSSIFPDKTTSYTVLPGDWLSKIARQFNIGNDALMTANPGIDPDLLVPGQILKIPNSSGFSQSSQQLNPIPVPTRAASVPLTTTGKKYTVQPGDWFYAIARRFDISVDALEAANPNVNPSSIYAGIVLNIPESSGGNPPPPPISGNIPPILLPPASPSNPSTVSPLPSITPIKTSTPIPTSGSITIRTGGFGYGMQVNWTNVNNDQEIGWVTGMGFSWTKAQVRWCDFEQSQGVINYGQIDQLVNAASSKGVRVMFSIVCAPNWSRADGGQGGSGPPDDLQKAADFMATLAARYCGKSLTAIEVWNEQNLLTEWHGKSISAAIYMDLLKRSYSAIKSRCPSILVISGAPSPTGVTNSTAIDDVSYLQQMYANGLKQYSDAVGGHPSGFCNSPDSVEGASNPCNGQFNNHRSFFFKRTLESYRSVMEQNGDSSKRIWVTEFGWGVDPSPKPGYEYTKFITEDLQAAWEVKAFQNMKAYGYIGVAFLWNLDFTDMNSETGAFHILNRRAYNSLAGMVK